jgi:hypothetical protein
MGAALSEAYNTWENRGLVFAAPGVGTMCTHAMLPTPLVLSDHIRVFMACCDNDLRGRIFRVDLDRDDPLRVIAFDTEPVLDLGAPNSFDEHGVNPSQIVERDGRLLMYYIGWQRVSAEVPYTLFAALAVSEDGGLSFLRHGEGQILHAARGERLFRTAPFVFPEFGCWRMLYIGGGEFFDGTGGKRLPTYSLCQARSTDGLTWDDPPLPPLLEPDHARGEIGFGRPVLWHEAGRASLIISRRTMSGYTLQQATQHGHALKWAALLDRPAGEWDSAMTCFGAPCRAGDWEYLFYNGNRFGRSGFGLARRPVQEEAAPDSITSLMTLLETRARAGT